MSMKKSKEYILKLIAVMMLSGKIGKESLI